MKKLHFLVLIVVISCSKDKENDQKCIDESLIDVTSACIEIYDPVCGCDGNTDPNYCYAQRLGVISYVSGECGNQ